ncbi:flavin reductase family protein [Aspergillus lucknowensis]|uniref:Flavin reductase like domain-containing protein n=1 Tax=Aspergillus lucknowensis TaxID=176173 RepID=A0ABR4M5N6_9EURO
MSGLVLNPTLRRTARNLPQIFTSQRLCRISQIPGTLSRYRQKSTMIKTSAFFKTGDDFAEIQASRPDFQRNAKVTFSKPPKPDWKEGDGGNDGGESLKKHHVEIDPYEEGRRASSNYKLLISGIVPRPIALISTKSKDGKAANLAPFSYAQVINHDPPLFTVGFVGSLDKAKDSLKNLTETQECVINIISEHFVEAANATAVNAPYGASEWEISGLHQAPSSLVQAARVKESILSIEGKLVETKEFESRTTPGKKTGVLAIIEGVRFWVREDAVDEEKSVVDLRVLKPISRLGGLAYGRTTDAIEIPRPKF